MILRRHLFTNVCILFTVCLVILHVSELYNRTDLTLELNILILVFSLISFDFQILLSMRKATRAFWIRALVSSSVPPVLLILLFRAVVFKCLTYSTFDNVTYDVKLPLGWDGSIFSADNESHIYPNMCAKVGCIPTVVSKRGGGVQTGRQRKLQLYIVGDVFREKSTVTCQ